MTLPKCETAVAFVSLMERIWDGDLHHLYDEYENALKVARLNAEYLWPGRSHTGDAGGQLFQFPDGSRAWVKTGACEVYGRWSRRPLDYKPRGTK